jgi:hypothetical protein
MYIFREIRKAVFGTKVFFICIFQHFFKNYGSEFSSFFSEITLKPITFFARWIEKSLEFIFLSYPRFFFLATLGPKTSDKKSGK